MTNRVFVRRAAQIPGFGGQIYAPGDPDYDKARHQYATSSYPEEQAVVHISGMTQCLIGL